MRAKKNKQEKPTYINHRKPVVNYAGLFSDKLIACTSHIDYFQ